DSVAPPPHPKEWGKDCAPGRSGTAPRRYIPRPRQVREQELVLAAIHRKHPLASARKLLAQRTHSRVELHLFRWNIRIFEMSAGESVMKDRHVGDVQRDQYRGEHN